MNLSQARSRILDIVGNLEADNTGVSTATLAGAVLAQGTVNSESIAAFANEIDPIDLEELASGLQELVDEREADNAA